MDHRRAARAEPCRPGAPAPVPILTGVGTVLADDPTDERARWWETPRQPLKIIVDSHLNTPPAAKSCTAAP